MANRFNLRGTKHPSFQIGANGPIIYQGTTDPDLNPDVLAANDGDLYIRYDGASSSLYQKRNATWSEVSNTNLDDLGSLTPDDGNIIVGNGTEWIVESGNIARTSLGLGDADAVTHASLITTTSVTTPLINRGGAGNASIFTDAGANIVQIGGVTSTVLINGNLQVTGNTTTIDVGTVQVEDQNILVNRNGNLASAALAGIDIEANSAVAGYLRSAADNANLEFKAPAGSRLTLDINSNSLFTVSADLTVSGASIIDQDVSQTGDPTFNSLISTTTITSNGVGENNIAGGLTVGSPTGGYLGDGIINAEEIRVNGTLITPGVDELDDLNDVNLTAPANQDILYYDGSEWINSPAGSTAGVQPWDNNLDDIVALVHTDGNIIVSDGTDWTSGDSSDINSPFGPTVYTPTNSTIDGQLEGIDDALAFSPSSFYYIASNGDDINGDGSILRPFATISGALVAISPNPATTLMVLPGSYTEDITINSSAFNGLTIQGLGVYDSHVVEILGHVTITGAGVTRIRFKDIQLDGQTPGTPTLTITDTDGRHYFDNVSVVHANGSSEVVLRINGSFQRWCQFDDSAIDGNIELVGTPLSSASFSMRSHESFGSDLLIDHENWNVRLVDLYRLGQVVHNAGELHLDHVTEIAGIAGESVISTADNSNANNKLIIEYCDFQRTNNTYSIINKTGNCPWIIHHTNRDVTNDILTGPRTNFGSFADDIDANRTPVNYSVSTNDVKDHLQGIDDALDFQNSFNISGETSGDILYYNGSEFVNEQPGSTSGIQAWNDNLDDIAALTHADGNIIVSDGTDWVVESGNTARSSLGVGDTDDVTHNSLELTDDLVVNSDAQIVGIKTQGTTTDGSVSREYVAKRTTSNAATTELFIDGISQRLLIPANTTWYFEIRLIGRRTDSSGEQASYKFEGIIDREVAVGTTSLIGDLEISQGETNPAWQAAATADMVNGALRIAVNGEAGKTIKWVAFVRTVEVTN